MRILLSITASLLWTTSTLQASPLSFRDLFDPNAGQPIHDTYGVAPASELEAGHPRDRIAPFDVEHYDLTIGVEPVGGVIGGVAKITFKALTDGLRTVTLDATQL